MQETIKPKLIVVLGMHRAGTSAVTRGLEVLSVSLGNNLMPANEDVNPKGFFEDLEVNALNIEMLSAMGSDWSRVSPISTSQLDFLRQHGFMRCAADLLRDKCRDVPVFGCKDPRMSKLLPFWNDVFDLLGYEIGFVLVLRNPLSVAKSLEKRDGLQASHSFYLWLTHMLESLRGSQGRSRLVIDYDQLMQSPAVQINRLAIALSLKVDETALQSYTTDFLENNLRHTTYKTEDLLTDPACPALVKEVFDWLRQAACDEISLDDPRLKEAGEAWLNEFERQKITFELLDDQLGHIERLEHEISVREAQIAQVNQKKSAQEAAIATLNQTVADQRQTIIELTDQAAALEQQALALQEDLTQVKETERQVFNSRSWHLTRPLRDVRGWISKRK